MLGRTASASADEKTKVQERLRTKYPQMYETPGVSRNKRVQKQAGDTSLTRFVAKKLKKKYGGK